MPVLLLGLRAIVASSMKRTSDTYYVSLANQSAAMRVFLRARRYLSSVGKVKMENGLFMKA